MLCLEWRNACLDSSSGSNLLLSSFLSLSPHIPSDYIPCPLSLRFVLSLDEMKNWGSNPFATSACTIRIPYQLKFTSQQKSVEIPLVLKLRIWLRSITPGQLAFLREKNLNFLSMGRILSYYNKVHKTQSTKKWRVKEGEVLGSTFL